MNSESELLYIIDDCGGRATTEEILSIYCTKYHMIEQNQYRNVIIATLKKSENKVLFDDMSKEWYLRQPYSKKIKVDNELTDRELMVTKLNAYVKKHGTNNVKSVEEILQIIGAPEKKGIILPSDYCYNRYNNGLGDFEGPHLLERIDSKNYRVLGEGYSYSGLVYHKPKGEPERVIGKWEKGVFSWSNEK